MATPREPPELVKKMQRRREGYRDHGRIYRALWVTAGATVLLIGLLMVIFPGPALIVIPAGLAMLSLEFGWAQRLLDRSLERGLDAKDAFKDASPKQKAAGATGALLAAGAIAVAAASFIL